MSIDVASWKGQKIFTNDGEKLGTIEEVLVHERTGDPHWLEVNTGEHVAEVTFVPFEGAHSHEGRVQVPYTEDQVHDAPHAQTWEDLSEEQRTELYEHWEIDPPDAA